MKLRDYAEAAIATAIIGAIGLFSVYLFFVQLAEMSFK